MGRHAAAHVDPGRGGYLDFLQGEISGEIFSKQCQA